MNGYVRTPPLVIKRCGYVGPTGTKCAAPMSAGGYCPNHKKMMGGR